MAGFTAPVPTSPLDHAEGTDALALAVAATARQQREIAREVYRQITALEDWEHEAIERLYLRLMDAAPETLEAEEAYWRLGNLYMRGFEPARNAETAALLEHYRERYPDSDLLDRRFALF